MQIFDFSNLNQFLNESINKSTLILSSEPFYFNNKKTLRIIISNLNEGKRLVFLIPCNKIIANSGYSHKEVKSMINSFSSIKNYLFESINESNNKNNLPKITELNQKDIWKTLRFRYIENGQSGFKYAIIIDASDKFSEQFLHGLVIAMRTSSKETNTYRKDSKNVYLEDWKNEGFDKESYACCFSEDIQQLPVENFSKTARKLGEVTSKDWNNIREEVKKNCKGADINTLKIKNSNKTSTSKKQRPIPLVPNTTEVIRYTYNKNGQIVTDLVPEKEKKKNNNSSIEDTNPQAYDSLRKLLKNLHQEK